MTRVCHDEVNVSYLDGMMKTMQRSSEQAGELACFLTRYDSAKHELSGNECRGILVAEACNSECSFIHFVLFLLNFKPFNVTVFKQIIAQQTNVRRVWLM